jgi:hypothetical protein
MNIAIRAAIVALSIGASIGTAYADSSGGTIPNTFFNQLPGVAEKPSVQNVPAAATTPDGTHAYVTQSSHGTWLFQGSHGGDGTEG